MSPDAILHLLRERIGLDAASIGPRAVDSAVDRRMTALGIANKTLYANRASADPEELQQLINAVVVPESWFYRGRGLFEFLANHARTVLASRPDPTPFRALSLPCSNGEEPYSLAMALDQAGVSASQSRILGVDISTEALARARKAEYREFAFRELDPSLRDRYFRERAGRFDLLPEIRSRVEFRQGNLLDLDPIASSGPFDLILCRNLLIYLTSSARATAIDRLRDLLAPGGWLGLGHGEPLPAGHSQFDRVGPEGLLLYARPEIAKRTPVRPAARTVPKPSTALRRPSKPAPAPRSVPATPTPPTRPEPSIAEARRLADAGQIDASILMCESILLRGAPTAEMLCLQGILLVAKGLPDQAEAALRRALYLDPRHPDALENLMLLLQQRGQNDEAQRLRGRLLRHGSGGTT